MENSLSTNEKVVESIKIRRLAFHPNTLMCIPKFHLYLLKTLLLFVLVYPFSTMANNTEMDCHSPDTNALQIAVVARRDTIESRSLRQGVLNACLAKQWKSAINILPLFQYDDEDGFDVIADIVKNKSADVIIGPSESGLFSNLYSFLDFEKNYVPIISPIVTIQLGNEADNWFFRTNVDAAERAKTMYDFLSKKGIKNIAMLYSDQLFGETAENAFREVLSASQREKFDSFRFEKVDDARAWLLQVKKNRPEAIGIIGSRTEVKQFYSLYKRLPLDWNQYDPYMFTIVDIRSLAVEDTYFLSVGQKDSMEQEGEGELTLLTYDTTSLVFEIADDMLHQRISPDKASWPISFRKRLMGKMSGSSSSSRRLSGMELVSRENDALPKVMTMQNGAVIRVIDANLPGEQREVVNWFDIRKRRFGIAPIVNLSLVAFIVMALTLIDLRRTHRVRGKDLFRIPFLLLVLFNVSMALIVFVCTAEQNIIAWDSLFGALTIAFGYSAILKTTIFETKAGVSLGFRRYYDNLVTWIYDKIRRQQFEKVGPVINYIAFANSRTYLKTTLSESYAFAGARQRKEDLELHLQEELDKELTTIGKRKVLARELLDEVSWFKLQQRRIVPRNIKRKGIQDPEPIVDLSVEYCFRNNIDSLKELKTKVQDRLSKSNNKEVSDEFNEDLEISTTPKSKMATCIRWLILLDGFNIKGMKNQGLLPADFTIQTERSWLAGILYKKSNALEKREYPRANIQETKDEFDVEVTFNEQVFQGKLQDISQGGAKICISQALPEEAGKLLLSSKTGSSLVCLENATTEIMNKTKLNDNVFVLGVSWIKLSLEARSSLNRYLTKVF
jgi:hypothetical protein